MHHPFELEIFDLEAVNFNIEAELTDEETTKVSGGRVLTKGLWEAGGFPCPVRPPIRPIKPPIFTTLALGEEGGCIRPPIKPPYIK